MFKTALFLLCSVAILVSGADETVNDSSKNSSTSGNQPLSDQHPNPITPSSTTSSTNISTPIPSPKTEPTTLIPNTTITPITSSTQSPTPSPTPSPAPAPAPVPPPETGKWIVKNGTVQTCIIAQMALQFKIAYTREDNKTVHKVLDLPATNETSVQGTCGTSADLEQNMTLTWNMINSTTAQNSLTLHFVKNITNAKFALHHLELLLAREELPGVPTNYSTKFIHTNDQFTTALNNSYRCVKTQTLNLTTVDSEPAGEIIVSNLQFQAFHTENTSNFGFAEDCAFDTPDIVPIAVGCALAALVVIVLFAYLVGRRRNQARGYLSM